MCIAIFKPAHRKLSIDRLRICDINNPDGAGFAFVNNGKLLIKKGFFNFEEFWSAFDEVQENNICLVHFRISTAGNKDAANCHPWHVTDDLAIIHNGTISDFQVKDSPQSDTGHFTEEILKELVQLNGPKFFLSPVLHYLIAKGIGDGSKMVFLDSDGDYSIINEQKGVKEDDVWYSNESFKSIKVKTNNQTNTAKPSEDSMFINQMGKNGKCRYGYIKAGGDGKFLTSCEISKLTTKTYRSKLKKLVDRGILIRLELDKDGNPVEDQRCPEGQIGLDLWLAAHSNGQPPKILEGGIIAKT